MPQLHIPPLLRNEPQYCEWLYGPRWRRPKLLCGVAQVEAIYGKAPKVLSYLNFRAYQKWMAKKMIELPGVYIAAEMGLGKTAAALYAIWTLLRAGTIRKVLIVAPVNVAENTWPEEIAKWTFSRDLDYTVITGDEDERIAALQRDDCPIHVINRENVVWLKNHLGTRAFDYDMLVYDEARRLASGRKRTKPVQRKDGTLGLKKMSEFGTLARMRYKFKRVVLLSGTPTPEGVIDLWGPLYIIDKGQRLGTSKSAFLQRWFRKGYDGYTWEPFDHSERQIMRIIRPVFFSLKEADYLKLPPLITRDHHVDLPQRAREQYDRFAAEMVLEEFDLEAVNGGVLTNKLLQMANGSVYLDDKSAKRIHDAKLDVLESIMEENYGKSVLVAYSFQFDMEEIKKRFKYVRIFGDTKNDLRDWNAGKIRMLLTHPASAGHGMNFQFGGHTGVWYGLPWSLELYLQFRKRLHRSGQEAAAVVLHRILAKYTADDAVATALDFKGARQDRITDAVKVHLARQYHNERMAA